LLLSCIKSTQYLLQRHSNIFFSSSSKMLSDSIHFMNGLL
jgi:hypothetical protein